MEYNWIKKRFPDLTADNLSINDINSLQQYLADIRKMKTARGSFDQVDKRRKINRSQRREIPSVMPRNPDYVNPYEVDSHQQQTPMPFAHYIDTNMLQRQSNIANRPVSSRKNVFEIDLRGFNDMDIAPDDRRNWTWGAELPSTNIYTRNSSYVN